MLTGNIVLWSAVIQDFLFAHYILALELNMLNFGWPAYKFIFHWNYTLSVRIAF